MHHLAMAWRFAQDRIAAARTGRHGTDHRRLPPPDELIALAAAAPVRDGVVYYLRVGSLIKIGVTGDLDQRLRSYPPDVQGSKPDALTSSSSWVRDVRAAIGSTRAPSSTSTSRPSHDHSTAHRAGEECPTMASKKASGSTSKGKSSGSKSTKDKLYFFEGRNTAVAAPDATTARERKQRGSDKIVAVRQPSEDDKKAMRRGEWVRTRSDGKSPAKSSVGKGRGQGPPRKK